MRLAFGLLGALVFHGLVLGLGFALLPRQVPRARAVAALDVDLVPARPDPVAPAPPSVTAPARSDSVRPARPLRAARHVRRAVASPAPAPALSPPAAEAAPPAARPGPAPAAPPVVPGGGPPAPAASIRATAPSSAKPRYRTNPPPEYPITARRRHEEGIVFVRVSVTPEGLAAAVGVERSCGHALLDDAAVEAVRRWTFEPARAAGAPVASLVVVPVRFSLSDAR